MIGISNLTHRLIIESVQFVVTINTQWDYIKPVFLIISIMMMIMIGLVATFDAHKSRCPWDSPSTDFSINRRLCLDFFLVLFSIHCLRLSMEFPALFCLGIAPTLFLTFFASIPGAAIGPYLFPSMPDRFAPLLGLDIFGMGLITTFPAATLITAWSVITAIKFTYYLDFQTFIALLRFHFPLLKEISRQSWSDCCLGNTATNGIR